MPTLITKQLTSCLEVAFLLAVFVAFAVYCAWVGPKALVAGRQR